MKYTEIEIGDEVIIHSPPEMWNSGLGGECPCLPDAKGAYPIIGKVIKKSPECILIGDYGFDLDYLIDYTINKINYSIY